MVNAYSPYQQPYVAVSAYRDCYVPNKPNYLVTWPKQVYAGWFQQDTDLLHETISPPRQDQPDNLAAQVFGNQLRQEQLSTRHLAALLYERAALYAQHKADISHRHLDMQEQLFCEKLISSPQQASRRQVALEKMLVQLESDRRKAELDFWKDTRDLRAELFERAKSYQDTTHRASFLEGIGGTYG